MTVALVTGTSSGIGLYAAVELAAKGHTVVATMRNTGRADKLRAAARERGVELDVRTLDVTDEAGAARCIEDVVAEHGRIDILVNNAGQGMMATAEELSMADVRNQLEVNYVGPVALTKLVLPRMREAGSGRILTVTSVGGAVGQPFAEAYCGAKFAVEGFMQSLAPLAATFGVWVSVVEPAAVASDFVDNANRAMDDGPYAALRTSYLNRMSGAFENAQSAQDAGRATADAATASEYRFRWQTSEAAVNMVSLSLADLDGSRVMETTTAWVS